jgi:hypothetical protein
MLGFETRRELHASLKQHKVHLHYDLAGLEQDQATLPKARGKVLDQKASAK